MTENKEGHDTATSILNMLYKILSAIAKVEAAFPAGDYGLNSLQNMALNNLNDVSCEMKKTIPEYKKMYNEEFRHHERWQLEELLGNGIISRSVFYNEIKARGLDSEDDKKDNG